MNKIKTLIQKELIVELRSGQNITLMFSVAILLAAVTGIGFTGSFLDAAALKKTYAPLVWILFLFSGTIGLSRIFDYELQDRAIEGLILTGVKPWKIYLSKLLIAFSFSFITLILNGALLALLMGVSIYSIVPQLALLFLLASLGYSALATLLAAVASSSKLKGLMLPLILFPLLFPLLLGTIELTADLLHNGALQIGSTWLALLIILDVVYIVLGINLYEYVIYE